MIRYLLKACFIISLSACSQSTLLQRQQNAEQILNGTDYKAVYYKTSNFTIAAQLKKNSVVSRNVPLVIYIEGDGSAWENQYKISENPTPKKPIALQLAIKDNNLSVLYLARPCQFVNLDNEVNCEHKYWTSHRYSQKVVDAYHQILSQLKNKMGVEKYELVGFSGGGVIAMLLAAQRTDILHVTTVAANLDHLQWSNYHQVTPLTGSLELNNFLNGLAEVSQYHLWGAQDTIVPMETNELLLQHMKNNTRLKYQVYDDFNHHCCWVEAWPDIQKNRKKFQ
ncbi:MAG: alpha/beta hydrolase [Gammaproteobacteria bacterium]|nr:alpha/beta hydrolase [Gammaproteobacteria bacterium]